MSQSNKKKWVIYILRCADGSFYTGITKDLGRRLSEHNTDDRLGARYTRTRRPVNVVYYELVMDRSRASKREVMIKGMSRKQKLALIGSEE